MNFIYHILIMSGIYIILCLSLNLMVGYGGLFNIGHGAFYGIGAYVCALLTVKAHMPFPWDLMISGVITGLFGVILGFPVLRLKNDYLALCTFGFGVVMYTIFNNWVEVTSGPQGIAGIPKPSIFSYSIHSLSSYLILVYVIVLFAFFILQRIVNSPFGKSLIAIREDQTAALAAGKNIAQIKIIVFSVGAFFAGLAGNLYVRYISIADPSAFVTDESFLIFTMVVFGGMASMKGSVLGALVLVLFPEMLRFIGIPSFYAAQIRRMLFGFLLVLVILKRPQGLLGKYKF
jgi:branched-chain amino acid transport system permease protein